MAANDVLQQALDLVSARLAEIADEHKRLERALVELGGKKAKRSPGRPRKNASTSKATGNGRRGAKPTQLIKFLRLARTHPESDNTAIAFHLGVKVSTATAMVSKVKSEGLVTRENKRLVVTAAGQALLNDQPKPKQDKPVKSPASKKQSAAKKPRKKAAAKKAPAPAAKSPATKSPAATPESTAGEKAGEKEKGSEGEGGGSTDGADEAGKADANNLLYDKK